MSQLSYLFGTKFKGGPDFNLNRTWHYDLNGIDLEVTLPDSNIVIGSPNNREITHFPFRTPGWFDANMRRHANHLYVPLFAGGEWAYLGPFWRVGREPYGIFFMRFWLKRVLPGYGIARGDMKPLESAVRWDYEEHFYADVPGDCLRGRNKEALREASERYDKPEYLEDEFMQHQKAMFIKNRTSEVPNKFESREIGMQNWLYYSMEKEPNYPVHHYCQALDEQFYLDVSFSYFINFIEYFHIWKDHTEEAEQRLIQAVRLNFPGTIDSQYCRHF